MRSTPELIHELEDEAKNHWYVAMVVGFESSTIFVQAKDENRLATLNSAMQAGGIPVGLIAADKTGNELTILARVYPEHQDSEEFDAEAYLIPLTNQIRDVIVPWVERWADVTVRPIRKTTEGDHEGQKISTGGSARPLCRGTRPVQTTNPCLDCRSKDHTRR
jgi:hypothetical protein